MTLAVGSFVLGFVVTFVVTPFTARLARRLGIFDLPGGHKQHATPTPYLGGIAIFGGLALAAIPAALSASELSETVTRQYLPIVLIALMLGAVGLWDDIKGVDIKWRFAAQLVAATAAWAAGFRIDMFSGDVADFALTIFWIVGITNAFNLLDNMDGLSAGLAGIAALGFAALATLEDLQVLPGVAGGLAGAALGFLAHNHHPARIFMGDAGSTFLGFLLAVTGMSLEFDNLQRVTFIVPVVILGVPIFDTALVVVSRAMHRRPIFSGGRDHASHRLVAIGLPVHMAVAVLYAGGIFLGGVAFAISRSTTEVAWTLAGFVAAMALFFGLMLLRVPVYSEDVGYAPIATATADPDEIVQRHAAT